MTGRSGVHIEPRPSSKRSILDGAWQEGRGAGVDGEAAASARESFSGVHDNLSGAAQLPFTSKYCLFFDSINQCGMI